MLAIEVEVQLQGKPSSRALYGVWISDLKDGGMILAELGVNRPASPAFAINNSVHVKLGALVAEVIPTRAPCP